MNTKKKYNKPDIEFVDFSLSSSIAGSCGLSPNQAQFVCMSGTDDNGWTVYASKVNGCNDVIIGKPGDNVPDICYHVPIADTNVFSS